jgi:hypothetical protein
MLLIHFEASKARPPETIIMIPVRTDLGDSAQDRRELRKYISVVLMTSHVRPALDDLKTT